MSPGVENNKEGKEPMGNPVGDLLLANNLGRVNHKAARKRAKKFLLVPGPNKPEFSLKYEAAPESASGVASPRAPAHL